MLSTILVMTLDSSSIDLFVIGNNSQAQFDLITPGLILAQQFQNTDLMGNMQTGWTDFLQSGKAGVLAIGLVVGYMVRGITR